jgi:serine/threonine-protein kinase
MGAVWRAQQTALDVPCAVKFIHEDFAKEPEVRARFEREAKAAAQLRSPYVVQILDHGTWEGLPYIAMELLEGEDLEHRLLRRGALSPQETLAITVQVGRALSKAHAVGLVHRDLKPANIFLTRDEDREIVKVLDFGIAKMNSGAVELTTKTGAVLGTPHYMSPEQARGAKNVDHRSDLWALAVVVYECITGEMPFTGESLGDLLVKIIVGPPPVPSRVSRVTPAFDAWWARAASQEPAARFQNAKELIDRLGLALGVTVGAELEVGSARASSGLEGEASLPRQSIPSRDGVSRRSPSPSGGPTPIDPAPSGAWPARTFPLGARDTPYPNPAMRSASMMTQRSFSVPAAPPRRTGWLVAGVVGVVALAGGAFFTLRFGVARNHTSAATGPVVSLEAPPILVVSPRSAAVATAAPSVAPAENGAASSTLPPASASAPAPPAKGRVPIRRTGGGPNRAQPPDTLGF